MILNQDLARARWARSELQGTRKFLDRHTLIVGAEYQNNLRQYQANYDPTPYTEYLNVDHGGQTYAAYGQGEFALHRHVLLNAGLRYDHFASFGGTVNPRLGLIYSPTDTDTIKALYGKAFRAPNDYQLNFASPNFTRNPNLQPSTIRTYELVYERYFPPALRLSATAYRYDIDDLIVQVSQPDTGVSSFQNTAAARAHGVELQLEGRYAGGIVARGSYAWQRAENVGSGETLTNSPRHLGKLNVSVPLISESLFGSVELQYNAETFTPNRLMSPSYTVLNATLSSRELSKGTRLSLSAYNLLNVRYTTPRSGTGRQEAIQQDGRSLRAELAYKFGLK